jgi:hypothetical protein
MHFANILVGQCRLTYRINWWQFICLLVSLSYGMTSRVLVGVFWVYAAILVSKLLPIWILFRVDTSLLRGLVLALESRLTSCMTRLPHSTHRRAQRELRCR